MNYNLEIQKFLLETEKITNYEDKISLLKQAIKVADANRDTEWSFDLRMNLIRNEQVTNHSNESLVAFAWILEAHDNNPGMFSNIDILLEYKWIAGVVFNNLNISLEQVDNILNDFRKRLNDSGYSSREYFNIKINQSLFKGEKILAREYLELRELEPIDSLYSSHNDLTTTIYVEMLEGDFERAIAHISEFTANQSLHKMNIRSVYSGLIYYLGGKNYDPMVEKYFEEIDKGFAEEKKYPYQIYEMSLMMYYMAKHRKDRAWAYFDEFVNWEIAAEEALKFDFALSILPLLKDGGKRRLDTVSIRHPYYREDNTYDLNDLYQYYKNIAKDLADKFDQRNGNKHFSDQINEELEYLNDL